MSTGSDVASSYVAKAAEFYWVMSFPVGATSLPAPTPPIPPPFLAESCVDIPVGQFNKKKLKKIMGHTRLKRSIGKCGSDCQVSVALMYFLLSVQWSCLISLQWDLIGFKNGPS